jgi:hypothetical protein
MVLKQILPDTMNPGKLPTKRPFNPKVLLFIVILLIPATYAVLPYSFSLASASIEQIGLPLLLVLNLINVGIYAVLAGIGLYAATRIGFGLPFVENWLKKEEEKEPMANTFKKVLIIAVAAGVAAAVIIIVLDGVAFGPLLQTELEASGVTLPENIQPPAWQGALASFSAGITEEVMFRLFGVTVLAWIGSFLFKDAEGRPIPAVFWTANIMVAVGFGLAHLPATVLVGIPLTPLVISRAIVLNGVGGVIFGWLYWTRGLESAMVAHFSTDIVLHVILVLVASLL